MESNGWRLRAKVFFERLWQPTSACMTCMPGSWGNLFSQIHWTVALQTGLATGLLAVLLSFTPIGRLFHHRYGNALLVACLTTLGDAYSHPGNFGSAYSEALLTGAVSGLLALAGSYVFEDRARRLRSLWAKFRA
jgi:hypothetical protein